MDLDHGSIYQTMKARVCHNGSAPSLFLFARHGHNLMGASPECYPKAWMRSAI